MCLSKKHQWGKKSHHQTPPHTLPKAEKIILQRCFLVWWHSAHRLKNQVTFQVFTELEQQETVFPGVGVLCMNPKEAVTTYSSNTMLMGPGLHRWDGGTFLWKLWDRPRGLSLQGAGGRDLVT